MKKLFKRACLLMFVVVPLVASGCDSDEEGGGDDTTMMDTTTGGDTSGGTDTMGGTDGDVAMQMGACTNMADLAIIEAANPDPVDVATDCGSNECISDPDPRSCTVTCMNMAMDPALTDACAGCYAESVACTIENCIGECVSDPESDACIQCREDEGCTPGFFDCSGLPRN